MGAAVGAGLVGLIWLPLATASSFDLSTGNAIEVGLGTIAVAAALGALLGHRERPLAWRDAVLPAVALPPPRTEAPPVSVFVFAGPDVESGRLEDLRRRLSAAGVQAGGAETRLSEPWPAPTEVRYFDERDSDAAEALAFWLGRALSQPTVARLQHDASVPRGELDVRLAH